MTQRLEDLLRLLEGVRGLVVQNGVRPISRARIAITKQLASRGVDPNTIRDAYTQRRIGVSVDQFDRAVDRWIAGDPVLLRPMLVHAAQGPGDIHAIESFFAQMSPPQVTTPIPPPPQTFPSRGTPDVAARLEIERAAIQSVAQRYRDRGYSVASVERDHVGWDLEARKDGELVRLEVKGLSAAAVRAELTPNEYAQMKAHRAAYRLCIVNNAGGRPKIAEFCWDAARNDWFEEDGRRLMTVERIAAVVSA